MDRFILPPGWVYPKYSAPCPAVFGVLATIVYTGVAGGGLGLLALESVYAAGFHLRLRTPIQFEDTWVCLMLPVYWAYGQEGLGRHSSSPRKALGILSF